MPHSSTPPQNLKHRVFTCLTKLSDRDTQALAATELESIARTLDPNSVPVFLSCIHSTDASDKSPVRKQCVHVLEILSETHGNTLSPYLSKILANIIRRLRDPDSSVRSACVNSVSALSTHITKQPFSSFLKPLTEALFTEQDPNSQIGAALCLAAAIDAAPDPDPARLAKLLLRFEKLLKYESFKAKPALLTLIGSVIESGGASTVGALRNLVPCVVEFLSSGDWAARKAAAETLTKLAVAERDILHEFKAKSLKVFENRRFDKVKVVRVVMNQMLEAWNQIPDESDEVSPPPQSHTYSQENVSDGRYPPGSKISSSVGSAISQMRKKSIPASRSITPYTAATNVKNRSPLSSSDKRMTPGIFRKLDNKNWNVEVTIPNTPSVKGTNEGDLKVRDENIPERNKKEKSRFLNSEMKRALFSKNLDDKMLKYTGCKTGSRVVPCQEESQDSTVQDSNIPKDQRTNHKECEDLSLIRNQLVQIEKQQSSLMDLLQSFIGNSQNGMRSLESRVHGLELALDEISYDLAASSGRMYNSGSRGNTCCLLPGADFLSSKFRRKTQARYSTSRFSTSSGTPSVAAMQYRADKNGNAQTSQFGSSRFRLAGRGGFIVNPLADIQSDSRGMSGMGHT
ncbi:Microtubule-associated protein TORTIFOLIA1 [Quillaja saponaria]|uniref:Microtubule-associated protein TORTIFOLIA1 n=1 Tax=Quillaja saponaria TaxID=32244 RepID=A0AAD7LE29_QUISA|nr:Microtubule-associated protein TORTIFOLIA1 [Quillaja saponaria]